MIASHKSQASFWATEVSSRVTGQNADLEEAMGCHYIQGSLTEQEASTEDSRAKKWRLRPVSVQPAFAEPSWSPLDPMFHFLGQCSPFLLKALS
jgi:hypothetical protein